MSELTGKARHPGAQPLLSSLQVFRGVAALLVVLFHTTYQMRERFGVDYLGGAFQFGYTGVDFFFVLSGFVILYVHHNDIGVAQRAGVYLLKRVVRIYPIYWLVASLKIITLLVVPSMSTSDGSGIAYLIKSFLLLPQANLPVIGVAWTLSYELLFYLFFLTFVLLGKWWAIASTAVWVAAIVTHAVFDWPARNGSYLLDSFLLNERNLEFLFGCAVAGIVLHQRVRGQWLLALMGLVGFSLSAVYVNWHGGQPPASFALTFGLSSALLLAGSVVLELRHGYTWPAWLTHLGDASYSIYLTHVMFLNAGFVLLDKSGLARRLDSQGMASLLALTAVAGGVIFYRIAERPLLTWLRRRFVRKRPTPVARPMTALVQPKAES